MVSTKHNQPATLCGILALSPTADNNHARGVHYRLSKRVAELIL